MQSKSKTPVIEQVRKETSNGSGELQVDGRLVKFFEILMQIDQRQKRNGENN